MNDDIQVKSNIKLLKNILATFKIRKILKKEFNLTLDNYLVLIYLNEYQNEQKMYFMTDIINYIGIDQSRIVKSVKFLSKRGFLEKSRDPEDGRNVIINVTDNQQREINHLLKQIFNCIFKIKNE
ncbi:transcriptional regulator, SarA/Rot family [Staphylococcus simiae]|uniref:HTH-type transcriptional regulator SarS n=1 Tax=Staphylococcus simiae CCM 7213 = CCUG 51256 TaxID=911238 RepID=G5JK36_9STAP|nr:winged helix DNA-binding protein [Staphylococcus simiae]EHJ07458.1 accessory regulator A-like protein [Staphylococcus simiae CCM 7213 = CCUG 51256]PNZ08951.1 transcriptional regulator [Staphylococcus simiae]SNV54959.1 HTH-type transcriptional regulator SarT [Staphylococcus simiae]